MAIFGTVTGADVIVRNLQDRRARIAVGVSRGLRKSGVMLQRESMLKVPVDFGPLKASAFTRATGTGFNTVVTVGYTASYALRVHELVGMKLKGQPRPAPSKGNYWDPAGRGQAKFLEQPVRTFGEKLNKTVQEEVDKA